ncbi:MAG: hypothetical protein O2907_05115 [Proteobacteria bacterium]|nr:hypothetical protein [Pseudomonadota bacterium]
MAVRTAVGGDPQGYALESEEFDLPTNFNPAQNGKFWPITSSVSLRFTDKAIQDAEANAEQAAADFQARYLAAAMSSNQAAMEAAMQEMMRAESGDGTIKEDMNVNVQFNMNPYAGIDPDGVLFEKSGVIALVDDSVSGTNSQVVVYFDPIALRETETLSKVELRTPQEGVSNRSGVFNVTVTLYGALEDLKSLAQGIDTSAVLAVIDSQ